MLNWLPPQNIRAEQIVLGNMMQNALCACNVRSLLNESDFYREAHRNIYRAIVYLVEHSEQADLITVTDYLRTNNQLEDSGGIAYITKLATEFYSESRFWACARTVSDKAKQRRNEVLLLEIRSLLEDILKGVSNG